MATTTDLERLVVQMSLDIRKFEQSLAKANGTTVRELTKIERRFEAANKRISGAVVSFARGLALGAVSAGIAGLSAAITGAVSQAALIGDLADKLGATTNQLQELQFGAVQANLSFDELSTSLLRFSKNTAEAASGQGDLFKVLRANGVELKGTFNENLRAFADLVKNAKNEQDALLLVTQAFGRGSDEMLEFLRNGADGLIKFGDEARRTGAILDEVFIREAQRIDDAWAALMLRMSTRVKRNVLVIIEAFQRIRKEGLDLGLINIVPDIVPPARNLEGIRAAPGTTGGPGQPRPTVIPTREEEEAQRRLNREREQSIRTLEREREQFHQTLLTQQQRTDAIRLETELLGESTQVQETARAKMELMNAAMEANILLTADVVRQIDLAAEGYGAAAAAFEVAQERMERIAEANDALRDSLQGFFKDIATGTKPIDALSDALKNLGDRLLDLALNQIFNQLFMTGAGQPAGGLLASLFHRGGVVGAGGSKRQVSPLAFVGAPRMHSGGIAGNEVPAILKRGEVVIPQNIVSRMSGGDINVQVINNNGSAVRTERGPGSRDLRVIVDDALAGAVADRRSKFNQAMSARGAGPNILRR